eukprot:SAG22_NODE_2028_length_3118_cov_1.428619_5_plen_270_part_01
MQRHWQARGSERAAPPGAGCERGMPATAGRKKSTATSGSKAIALISPAGGPRLTVEWTGSPPQAELADRVRAAAGLSAGSGFDLCRSSQADSSIVVLSHAIPDGTVLYLRPRPHQLKPAAAAAAGQLREEPVSRPQLVAFVCIALLTAGLPCLQPARPTDPATGMPVPPPLSPPPPQEAPLPPLSPPPPPPPREPTAYDLAAASAETQEPAAQKDGAQPASHGPHEDGAGSRQGMLLLEEEEDIALPAELKPSACRALGSKAAQRRCIFE